MGNLIKTGYFRVCDAMNSDERYISYTEYQSWADEAKSMFKSQVDMGKYKLYCACCREDILELIITSNHVLRVASNGNQEKHMDSCPKSISYAGWNEQSQNGIRAYEDSQILFNISLPAVNKAQSSASSSSSSGSGTGVPREKKTQLLDMVTTLNKIAWEKQTFSKKKEIREANMADVPQSWEYKTLDEFNRLFFGICNEVYCKCQGNVIPLINLCYRKDAFYSCNDWRRQWFIYAVIEKISPIKPSRKYQYVTVRMPSDKSASKAVIRVETKDFNELFGETWASYEQGACHILSGYVSRRVFKAEDGTVNEWINLIKGIVIRVNTYGLYVEDDKVAAVADILCKNHVIFKRPYLPLENYGSLIPSFEIERLHGKNLIIDCPDDSECETRRGFAADNDEYECICFESDDAYEDILTEHINMEVR